MTNAFTPIEILRPTILEFGNGTISAAARFAERIGARRPLVICDAFNACRVDALALPGAVRVFGDVKPEPDLPNLEKAVAMAKDVKPDLVVGFGGAGRLSLQAGDGDRAVRRRRHSRHFCAHGIERFADEARQAVRGRECRRRRLDPRRDAAGKDRA
jgi:hypothetical protein